MLRVRARITSGPAALIYHSRGSAGEGHRGGTGNLQGAELGVISCFITEKEKLIRRSG